jgi:hypothetical protein
VLESVVLVLALAGLVVFVFSFTGCSFSAGSIAPAAYNVEVLSEPSLVAYWRLGESGTNPAPPAKDSKDSHDGTYSATGLTLGVQGLIASDSDTAVSFDGTGSVDISFSADLNPPSFTVEAWVVAAQIPVSADQVVVASASADFHGYALVAGATGSWQVWVGDGNAFEKLDSGVAVDNTTTYLAATFDGSDLRLYVNTTALPIPTLAVSSLGLNTAKDLTIGGQRIGASGFRGVIDEVAVYNTALSDIRIATHMAANGWQSGAGPLSVTAPASNVSARSATVSGLVNPEGSATTYHFEYGTQTNYTAQTQDQDAGAGKQDESVSADLSGLSPQTTYHYAIAATNPLGTNTGFDAVFTTKSYADVVYANTALVNYWRLGKLDQITQTTLYDTKQGVYNGSYVNSPSLGSPGAIVGDSDGAVAFNGTNQYALIPRQIQNDFSIEFWFYATAPGTGIANTQWFQGAGLVDGEVAGVVNDFGTSFDGARRVWVGTGNPDVSAQSAPVALNSWHHVVFTRIAATGALTLYVDGAAVANATGGTQPLTSPPNLRIASTQSGTHFFTGSVDEVAIYATAIDASVVADHHQLGFGT